MAALPVAPGCVSLTYRVNGRTLGMPGPPRLPQRCRGGVANARRGKDVPLGFVEQDNSGKANIFGVMPAQLYTSSPTSDKLASSGLGGQQGLILLFMLIAGVGVATSFVLGSGGDQAPSEADIESLTAIAQRIAASS